MYKETSGGERSKGTAALTTGVSKTISLGNTSKVNSICDAILRVLEASKTVHLQNIITAHVCKSPADLNAGLLVVGGLQGRNKGYQFVKLIIELIGPIN